MTVAHGSQRRSRGGVGCQTGAVARDLALPRGHCGKGVAEEAVIAGNSELVLGSFGVGVVKPLVGRWWT